MQQGPRSATWSLPSTGRTEQTDGYGGLGSACAGWDLAAAARFRIGRPKVSECLPSPFATQVLSERMTGT